jgi:hypothetical protein
MVIANAHRSATPGIHGSVIAIAGKPEGTCASAFRALFQVPDVVPHCESRDAAKQQRQFHETQCDSVMQNEIPKLLKCKTQNMCLIKVN